MRHVLTLSAVLAGLVAATGAGACQAQDGRTLTWAGRPAQPAAATTAAGQAAVPGLIPHAGAAEGPAAAIPAAMPATPDRISRVGLTPASAWMPAGRAMAAAAPVVAAPLAAPPPAPAQPRPEPAPVAVQPRAAQPHDPMAPRADAPVLTMGAARPATPQPQTPTQAVAQVAPQAAPQAQPAPAGGARYYSVHRPHGQQPDAIQRPPPVYLDALPVTFDPGGDNGGEDLAAPPAAPSMVRDSNGRMRPAPMAIEHDIQ